jgi:hypothetical protein
MSTCATYELQISRNRELLLPAPHWQPRRATQQAILEAHELGFQFLGVRSAACANYGSRRHCGGSKRRFRRAGLAGSRHFGRPLERPRRPAHQVTPPPPFAPTRRCCVHLRSGEHRPVTLSDASTATSAVLSPRVGACFYLVHPRRRPRSRTNALLTLVGLPVADLQATDHQHALALRQALQVVSFRARGAHATSSCARSARRPRPFFLSLSRPLLVLNEVCPTVSCAWCFVSQRFLAARGVSSAS